MYAPQLMQNLHLGEFCAGCGQVHPKRTSLPDHCPCCMHPHDQHGHRYHSQTCRANKCQCDWPNREPVANRRRPNQRTADVMMVTDGQARRM